MLLDIELQVISSGYDRKTCWVHARPGMIPGDPPTVVVTMQKLQLTGTDLFYAMNEMRSDDGGITWAGPIEHSETLGRCVVSPGVDEGVSDFWPMWHEQSGVLLGTGHTVRYAGDELQAHPRPRSTTYSAYCPDSHTWTPWRSLEMPPLEGFRSEGAGSTQRVDLQSGEILLPTYCVMPGTERALFDYQSMATVVRCAFDGRTLSYL